MPEPLSGLDAAFLAIETPTSRMHVAGVLVLGPKTTDPGTTGGKEAGATDEILDVVVRRLDRVPRLRRRPVGAPLGLQRPLWADDCAFDVGDHVRAAHPPDPDGPRAIEDLVGELLSRPLPLDRPLWDMTVVEGLAGGQTAVVARLHHAILDGVSGATAMAALLDLAPNEGDRERGAPPQAGGTAGEATDPGAAPPPMPADAAGHPVTRFLRMAAASSVVEMGAVSAAVRMAADALVEVASHNRELASMGRVPPPAPFSAPRTSLNGNLTGQHRYATRAVPLGDLEEIRAAVPGATVNDVILAAVGGAMARTLERRGESVDRALVALVPFSTRGHASVPESRRAHVGNYVSGMLVSLETTVPDPLARLRAVVDGVAAAKAQARRAGGELLEDVLRAVPPVLLSAVMHGIARAGLFDRLPPPFNVVVSSVVVPDVTLWWAGRPVLATYPAGPIADGVGLNVTSMTYKDVVHFGLVGCPRLVPDLDEVADDLDDAVAELSLAALG